LAIPDHDIWRAAIQLKEQFGGEAERVAIRRTEEMNERNDLGGMLRWMRIRQAIVALQGKPAKLN